MPAAVLPAPDADLRPGLAAISGDGEHGDAEGGNQPARGPQGGFGQAALQQQAKTDARGMQPGRRQREAE